MSALEFLILGCGYTAARVARKLAALGSPVICTNRRRGSVVGASCLELDVEDSASVRDLARQIPEGMTILHSIPPISGPQGPMECTAMLLDVLSERRPKRIVYLSTTGVYGEAETVDERTAPEATTPRDKLRVDAERLVSAGPWSFLVLRPAAIYGPRRGVHWSVRQGAFRSDGSERLVSRIHVDDLAELTTAVLLSEVTGAFPVADEEASSSLDVARFSAELLGVPLPMEEGMGSIRASGRRVDGTEIRRVLGVRLRYRSFREGVPACLEMESAADGRR